MKIQRKFPHFLNFLIFAISLATVISFSYVYVFSSVTILEFLFSHDCNAHQLDFLSTISHAHIGQLVIFSLYFIFSLAIMDVVLNLIMTLPGIRNNSFIAICYKTFLIFYAIILLFITLIGALYFFHILLSRQIDISNLHLILTLVLITAVPFFQSVFKITAYHKYKRP